MTKNMDKVNAMTEIMNIVLKYELSPCEAIAILLCLQQGLLPQVVSTEEGI